MNAPAFDQFTRWLCPLCNEPGIYSWNKALHDGVDHGGNYPDPWILGDDCQECFHPITVAYFAADEAPRAIAGPSDGSYDYEFAAMLAFQANRTAGVELAPSTKRDSDWSRGCLAAKGHLQ